MLLTNWLFKTVLPSRSRRGNRRSREKTKLHRAERLEPKLCLTAGSSGTASQIQPEWFATLSDGSDETPAGDRWILQLTTASTAVATNVSAARDLLAAGAVPVTVLRGLGQPGLLLVSSGVDPAEVSARVEASGLVESFGLDTSVDAQMLMLPPSDTDFASNQYSFNNTGQFFGAEDADINALDAWALFTVVDDRPGSLDVVVPVIDSGIDYTHPDLSRNIWLNQGEIPADLASQLVDTNGDGLITFFDLTQSANTALVTDSNGNGFIDGADLLADPAWENGTDDDGNGLTDDLIGWDFLNNDNDPFDDHRHGTHVAGTIGAVGNNGFGVAGINWDVSLMPLKFLNTQLEGSTSDAILAINYATMMRSSFDTNVRVMNASWGTLGDFNPKLQDAITAAQTADILFVAAAGNGDVTGRGIDLDGEDIGFYPASFDLDNIISVTATDNTDSLARFSNFGATSIDIGAPGVGIFGPNPGGNFVFRTGTSMATPHVTGTIALLASLRDFATATELRDAVLTSAEPLGSLATRTSTGGRLRLAPDPDQPNDPPGAFSVDTFAPRSSLVRADDITEDDDTPQIIDVRYVDDTSVSAATIDDTDIVVRRLDDGTEFSAALQFGPNTDGPEVFARYLMAPPGGLWQIEDNGEYEIILQTGEVADTGGRANSETVLGSFEVAITFVGLVPVTTTSDGLTTGTLRSAIQAANAEPSLNTIVLRPGETYTLDLAGADEDASASGDLDITDELVIEGNGATIQVVGGIDRVLDVLPAGTLTLVEVTISGGNTTDSGGGIRSAGVATIERSLLTGNTATEGGAISSTGTTTLINTTVSGNAASTGGGVHHSAGSLLLSSVTVTANSATDTGGGIRSTANAQLQNTIVGGNTATASDPDTSGAFNSNGHNLISILGSAAGFVAGTNGDSAGTAASPVNALLGELKDNGGPTFTHRLLPGSAAIDSGNNDLAPAVDQRNITRPVDANRTRIATVDIGAHERNLIDIEGVKFRDDNRNGFRDHGEPGLAGWTVYLDMDNDGELDAGEPTTITIADDHNTNDVDEGGSFRFSELPAGRFVVRELNQPGWQQTAPATASLASFNLNSASDASGFRVEGAASGDRLGRSVSSAGDVNGDGFSDMIIGAHYYNSRGAAYVIFGGEDLPVTSVNVSTLDGTTGFRITGVFADSRTGASVSSAGDLNGDGFDDVVIGAYLASPNGLVRSGEAYVVFGKSSEFLPTIQLSDLQAPDGFRIQGIAEDDSVGYSASTAGDINGDGLDDLIIAAFAADRNYQRNVGEVYVIFGRSNGFPSVFDLTSLAGDTGFRVTGIDTNDLFGSSVSHVGDVNGDGLDDIIVGAPGAGPGESNAGGASYVIFGSRAPFAATLTASSLDGNNGFVIRGAEGSSGGAVSSAGDMNGDGIDDILIGNADANNGSGDSYVVFGKSTAFAPIVDLSGLNEHSGFRLRGVSTTGGDRSGRSLASVGDINGDMFDDLIIGAYRAGTNAFNEQTLAGESYIVYGRTTEFEADLPLGLLDGTTGFRIEGAAVGDQSGRAVSGAGDFNGDGFPDVLIGAPQADGEDGDNAGAVYVVFGRRTPTAVANVGFWSVLANAGDTARDIEFGSAPLDGRIHGRVFRDLNANGIRDAGETGLEGWHVFLDGNNNGQLDGSETFVMTDVQGRYEFSGLEPLISYRVGNEVQQGFAQTFPDPTDGLVQEVFVGAGATVENIDFGNLDTVGGVGLGLGTLAGTYFVDGDRDGESDTGEGVADVSLFLDINSNGVRDSSGGNLEPITVTGSDGRYTFENLAAATYTVRAINDASFTQQFPRSNALAATEVGVGDYPQSIASGFFNSDDLPDLVVANIFTNDLTVLLNDGDSFNASGSVFTGLLQPQSVDVADFNQDGRDDLVVGYAAGGRISVLFGLGNGSFSAPVNIDTGGGGEVSVSTGIFTNDVFPDIAAASSISDRAYVIQNTDGSNFSVLHTVSTGEAPSKAVFANLEASNQFNSNDRPDLVVSSFLQNRVETYFQGGTGSLSGVFPTTVGTRPTDMAVADFDGDGSVDVVVANQLSDSVSVLFNNGFNGQFDASRIRSYPAGTGPTAIEAVDVNVDGFVDLVVTNGSDSNLAILRNLGNGVFQSPESFGVGLVPISLAFSVTSADFDGDGDPDLAVAKGVSNQAAVLENTITEGSYRVILDADETVSGLDFLVTNPPTPTIASSETSPTGAASIPVTVSFSEVVSGFDANDVSISGATVAGFQTADNQTFSFIAVPTADGTVTIDVAAGAAQSLGGQSTGAAAQFSVVVDRTSPTVDIVDVSPDPRLDAVGVVTLNFSEDVSGVDRDDLSLTRGGQAVGLEELTLTQVSPSQYTIDLTAVTGGAGDYTLTFVAAASGVTDAAGNSPAADAVDNWIVTSTSIGLDDAGNLVISSPGVVANVLTLTTVGGEVVITDPNNALSSSVGTIVNDREVRVALNAITGGRIITGLGPDNDSLNATGLSGVLLEADGGAGNDSMTGSESGDTFRGGTGDDELRGEGGDDFLDGGPGDDLIFGGAGNDRLIGGAGVNQLQGDAGRDTTVNASVADTVAGNAVVVDLRIVVDRTMTTAGHAAALPENVPYLDEWDDFFIEVWASTPADATSAVESFSLSLQFDASLFAADPVEFGAAFDQSDSSNVNNLTGVVDLGAATLLVNAGQEEFVLLGRIPFVSDAADDLPNDRSTGYILPSLDQRLVTTAAIVSTVDGGEQDTILSVPIPEVWPVMYDLDDSGAVSFGDISQFAQVFGNTTASNAAASRSDFDRNGTVTFADVALFAGNFGRSRGGSTRTTYTTMFPSAWRPMGALRLVADAASVEPEAGSLGYVDDAAVRRLTDAAISSFETAGVGSTAVERLRQVDVVVSDLPGDLLGLTNGNRIEVDINAAGAGWFVDATPGDASEFSLSDSARYALAPAVARRVDLLSVIAHELGHVLGLDHTEDGFMSESLATGERRVPQLSEIDAQFTDLGELLTIE